MEVSRHAAPCYEPTRLPETMSEIAWAAFLHIPGHRVESPCLSCLLRGLKLGLWDCALNKNHNKANVTYYYLELIVATLSA